MKRHIVVGVLVVLLVALIGVNIARMRRGGGLPEVEAVRVRLEAVVDEVAARGEIRAKEEMQVVAQASGVVKDVLVEEGERVRKGEILVRLDTSEVEGALLQAEAQRAAAELAVRREVVNLRIAYRDASTALEEARKNLERVRELHGIGSASDEELRQAEDQVARAGEQLAAARQQLNLREGREPDAPVPEVLPPVDLVVASSPEVRQAEAQLAAAREQVERYVVRAGITGVVSRVLVKRGAVVAAGTPVAQLHDDSQLEVVAQVDEVDLPKVREGARVRVEADVAPDRELEGEVVWISPVLEQTGEGRMARVRIRLDEREGVWIGASCSVFIEGDRRTSPVVPLDAYWIEKDAAYVWRVEEDEEGFVVRRTEVKVGSLLPGKVEVREGLSEGDLVVPGRRRDLEEGMRVKVKVKDGEEGEG
ncbi:efflux RND transporter periplasmic adaptor subunit [Spirochaeta thermophila]|uniref:Efflux transporter, RND family, MFP subunit n=1 Tax=Winmispira thermophila (strain ATCC 49972 / DSM 6192 / RI 19.B1) TaxID=665571 RepID=E0RQ17_WINT6|nr:efflux RND transporter periplasmic adaptor subunit [Spirochaeta thermophila]ADN02870.1 efflux transporter, RND family, MFP subunit [Spirochaeta thermophila DSM 6192]